ncbi:4-coumarate,CoA ligase-like protein, partial [Zymoseptoria tritici IPO323]
MVFKNDDKLEIPTVDILSWYFYPGSVRRLNLYKPVYIDAFDPKRQYTHGQARTTIRKLVAGLRKAGLRQGDVVCVHSFNDINYPVLANGIIAAGGIYSGTNPAYQPYELAHAIKVARIKFLVVEPEILKHALEAATASSLPQENIFIFNNRDDQVVPSGFKSWRTLLQHGEEDWVRWDDAERSKSTTAAHLFSSGTTGLPKAAMLSHYNLIAQHCQITEWKPKPYAIKKITATPMFHVATAPTCHFSPLKDGADTVIMRRFDTEGYLKTIQDHQITDVATVPPMVLSIIQSDLEDKYSLKSVKFATCGAAPLEKRQQARFQALLSEGAVFTQVWATTWLIPRTETTCICTNTPFPGEDDTGSVGRPVPGIELKLVDAEDPTKEIHEYGVRGEVCIRGVTVIRGYLDEQATRDSWDSDGFFHTGDIAYCEKGTGKWYIVDRKKDLMKVRGFQVAPPELEAVLLEHPGVYDAAVIGVKKNKDDDSEYPRAYIVRRDNDEGRRLDGKAVFEYMGTKLAKFKRPEGGVVFMDAIPKNPSGKILKRELRE